MNVNAQKYHEELHDKNILSAIKALMLRVHTTTRTDVWGGNRLPGVSEAEG